MSNNKQQTAVDWLIDKLTDTQFLWLSDKPEMFHLIKIINQAKEMEKKQHANTWDDSRVEDKGDNYIGKQKSFNDYWNETYGGDK